jgi:hypothetical protein
MAKNLPGPLRGTIRPRSAAGPRCKICRDPRLYEINSALASGMAQREAARKFGFNRPLMDRHAVKHLGAGLLNYNNNEPVLEQIRKLNLRTLRILSAAESGKERDPNVALAAIREARANLTLIGKLTGELKTTEAAGGTTRVEVIYVDKLAPAAAEAPAIPTPAIEVLPAESAAEPAVETADLH